MDSIKKVDTEKFGYFKYKEWQSACKVGKNIYIFGGLGLNTESSIGNFIRFNADEMSISCYHTANKISTRSGHSCCFYSIDYVIIDDEIHSIGGMDSNGSLLKDVFAFNLKTNLWTKVKLEGEFEGRAYFPTSVVYVETHNFTRTNYHARIQTKGIYMFGGVTNEGINETLSVIYKKNTIYNYRRITTSGKGPCARYQHSMNYCDYLNIIIVYGGRNEGATKSKKSMLMLNDMFILSVDTMVWTNVDISDLPYSVRHSADTIGNKLLIFGGLTDKEEGKNALIMTFNKICINWNRKKAFSVKRNFEL